MSTVENTRYNLERKARATKIVHLLTTMDISALEALAELSAAVLHCRESERRQTHDQRTGGFPADIPGQ